MNKIMWSSLYSTWMIIFMCTAFLFRFCKVNTNCCTCTWALQLWCPFQNCEHIIDN